jgi:hypothetical protein
VPLSAGHLSSFAPAGCEERHTRVVTPFVGAACYGVDVAGQAKAGGRGWPVKTVSRVASSAISTIKETALQALMLEAVGLNTSKAHEPICYGSHHL